MEKTIEVKESGITLSESASSYLVNAISENTRRGYQADYRSFEAWCAERGVRALPATPAVAAEYFSSLAEAGRKASTITRARAAIRLAHVSAGHPDVTASALVKNTLKGIRRAVGTAVAKKSPTLTTDITAMVNSIDGGLKGTRDKALILMGFATGMRRSELVGIKVEHIDECAEGIRITLPRSKTDQEGRGRVIGVTRGTNPTTCPVRALNNYLRAAGIREGFIFRSINRHGQIGSGLSAQAVALVVKSAAAAAGLNPDNFSGHSLRAGLVTQAAIAGAKVADIMRQTGHKSHDTVMGYVRIANVFSNNASGSLGL